MFLSTDVLVNSGGFGWPFMYVFSPLSTKPKYRITTIPKKKVENSFRKTQLSQLSLMQNNQALNMLLKIAKCIYK